MGKQGSLAAVVLLAASCSSPPAAGVDARPVPGSTGPIDVEVWVSSFGLEFMMRERDRTCSCNHDELPPVGACRMNGDGIYCDCGVHPASCVDAIRLWDGADLVEELGSSDYRLGSLYLPIGESFELEIVGGPDCPGSIRAPIPMPRETKPVVTAVTSDDERLRLASYAPYSWDQAIARAIGGGLWSQTCRSDGSGPVWLQVPRRTEEALPARVAAVGTEHETSTELGTLRMRTLTWSDTVDVWHSAPRADEGDWTAGKGYAGTATLTISNLARTGEVTVDAFVSGSAASPRFSFDAHLVDQNGAPWDIVVEAGETTDLVRLWVQNSSYVGEVPHIVPREQPELGVPTPQRYALEASSVVLVGEGDRVGSTTIDLEIEWASPGAISLPLAMP